MCKTWEGFARIASFLSFYYGLFTQAENQRERDIAFNAAFSLSESERESDAAINSVL